MKAPGGCENLKAQAVGNAGPANHAAAPGWEDAEGVETSREALLVASGRCDRSPGPWEAKCSRQRLGAWAASEEEPKPMRGS
jgi:hypothetical protein